MAEENDALVVRENQDLDEEDARGVNRDSAGEACARGDC
jgi:hypothetical protein